MLTATHPDSCPGALVLDPEACTGYPVTGDSAGCIKVARGDRESRINQQVEIHIHYSSTAY